MVMFVVLCPAKQVVSVIRYGNREEGLIDDDENVTPGRSGGGAWGAVRGRTGSITHHGTRYVRGFRS